MDIIEAKNKFLDYHRVRRASPATTIITYSSLIGDFIKTSGLKFVEDITLEVIDEYATRLSMRGYENKTFRNKLVAVRSFVKYLNSRGLVDLASEIIEMPKNIKKEANFLTENELAAFLNSINDLRDLSLFFCIAVSGVRVSEVAMLKMSDVYNKTLFIQNGKGNKQRAAYITDQALSVVNDYIEKKRGFAPGYLFPNPSGSSLSRQLIARKCKKYALRASIRKKVTPHTLRHTFCTILANRGVDVANLRVLMGHESIRTTQEYIHFSNTHIESVYNQKMDFKLNKEKMPA